MGANVRPVPLRHPRDMWYMGGPNARPWMRERHSPRPIS